MKSEPGFWDKSWRHNALEIGKTLAAADKELHLWEDYLKALEKQKRGLMQKLLTGEVRVKP